MIKLVCFIVLYFDSLQLFLTEIYKQIVFSTNLDFDPTGRKILKHILLKNQVKF
jgi:hypothetical protein